MSKRAKVGVAAGVVVVLVGGAIPYADHVLTRRYERRIKMAVTQRYGGSLTLDNFHVRVLTSRATVDGFRYEDPVGATYRVVMSGGPIVVDIDGLAWDPEEIRFKDVVLERPELLITRTPRGDWDRGVPGIARDLLATGIEKAKKALGIDSLEVGRSPDGGNLEVREKKARTIAFARLRIVDARIVYEDHRFSDTPIKLTIRDFDFDGHDLSGADLWRSLLTADADGVLEVGPQSIDVHGRLRDVAGQPRKIWTLEAAAIDMRAILGPVLRPLRLDVQGGTLDVRLSHLFDVSLSSRSAIVMDYDLHARGLELDVVEGGGRFGAVFAVPAERIKAYVDERSGDVELAFSVEAAPDLGLLGKDAGGIVESIGKLTWVALKRQLFRSLGLEGLAGH